MTIADEIIKGRIPDFEYYLAQGESLDDIDEYGFTPLIETAITENLELMQLLVDRRVNVNKADVTGRTALHWAVDNNNLEQAKLLLANGINVNAHNRGGQPALVYPLLRNNWEMKQLLYRYGADLNFAQDFINAKLIGHRFSLKGDVDIVNTTGQFIELDYEGFFLEFSLDIIRNSLRRYSSNFAFRKLRQYFGDLGEISQAFVNATQLLKYQVNALELSKFDRQINHLLSFPLLLLPVAYKGHAITFLRCGPLWAKCDRGENSLTEGSVNIYYVANQANLNSDFLKNLLYKKQTKQFIHHHINDILDLRHIIQLPLSPQISGNCSWANVEAAVPTAYVMQQIVKDLQQTTAQVKEHIAQALTLYTNWIEWDKDRALEECVQSFNAANQIRKASKTAILAAVLFQSCNYANEIDMRRAEKILQILTIEDYYYVLQSYLEIYCVDKLTFKGNNLLKILDDCGINPGIGVSPVATGLNEDL